MKKFLISTMIMGSLLSVTLPNAQAKSHVKTTQKITKVYFAKGQINKNLVGKLDKNQDSVLYQFSAKRNQYTTLTLYPRQGFAEFANVGVITAPNGTTDGGKGGVVYQACLPQTGSYTLKIARNLMATNGDVAGYIAKLSILPINQSRQWCDK